jgi:hypothetical protein
MMGFLSVNNMIIEIVSPVVMNVLHELSLKPHIQERSIYFAANNLMIPFGTTPGLLLLNKSDVMCHNYTKQNKTNTMQSITLFTLLLIIAHLCQCSFFSIEGKSVLRYDMHTTKFTKEAPFEIHIPAKFKTNLYGPQVVNQEKRIVYGTVGNFGTWVDHNVYSILYRYEVDTKKTVQSSEVVSYYINQLILDPESQRLYGLTIAGIMYEYDVNTLEQKYIVANFSQRAHGIVSAGYIVEKERTYTYSLAGISSLVTLNLAKIPEVIKQPVDIIERIVEFNIPMYQFAIDQTVTLNGVPLIFSNFKHDIYVFRQDTATLVKKVQLVPEEEKFENMNDDNPMLIDPVSHELIMDVAIQHTGENFFFRMDTRTLEFKGQSVSSDPDFIYYHTTLIYVRD